MGGTGTPLILQQPPAVANTQAAENTDKSNATVLGTLRNKFKECKDFVLDHKQALANIGQIGGTAALVAGGAALMFSGIAANLSVAGLPLGIPLMVAGGVLLAGGTIFQIAHHIDKDGSTIGDKLRHVLKDTLANLALGTVVGSGVAAISAAIPLATVISVISVVVKVVTFCKEKLNGSKAEEAAKENNRVEILKQKLPENSKAGKIVRLIDILTKEVSGPAKSIFEFFNKDTIEILEPILKPLIPKDYLSEIFPAALAQQNP